MRWKRILFIFFSPQASLLNPPNKETKMSSCEKCKFRAKYDKNPKSFLGKLWRWHIGFCPGWKIYFKNLPEDQKPEIAEKYDLKSK
jgi:hypothetical protein